MLDALTDALFPVVDNLEDRIDAPGGRGAARAATSRQLGADLPAQAGGPARSTAGSSRSATTSARQDAAIIALPGLTRGKREYLRDVGDHLVQVTGELQRQIDDLTTLTSTYFNANANRLNRRLTRLTVIATFFLSGRW